MVGVVWVVWDLWGLFETAHFSEGFAEEPAKAGEGASGPSKLGCEDGEARGDKDHGGAGRHNHDNPDE